MFDGGRRAGGTFLKFVVCMREDLGGGGAEPEWTASRAAMGSVYIYIYYIISLRAAFVPLAPRYNIYGPILHILRHIPSI